MAFFYVISGALSALVSYGVLLYFLRKSNDVGAGSNIIELADNGMEDYTFLTDCNPSSYVELPSWANTAAEKEEKKNQRQEILNNGGWICHGCGKLNQGFILYCSCGVSKKDSVAADQEKQGREGEK